MNSVISTLVIGGIGLILLVAMRQLRLPALFVAGYAGWVLVTAALAAGHVYRFQDNATKPWLALGFAIPAAGLLLLARLPAARQRLSDPHVLPRLTRPHQVRVVGVVFLLAMAAGKIPAAFALPAGLGDIAVGLAAPRVIRGLHDGTGTRRAIWFNILGITDFVVAFAIAILAGPGRIQLLHVSPTTQQISMLPLVLIPTAAVPLLFALHVISLAKLRTQHSASTVSAHPVAATS
jgi:hypothetical protein